MKYSNALYITVWGTLLDRLWVQIATLQLKINWVK